MIEFHQTAETPRAQLAAATRHGTAQDVVTHGVREDDDVLGRHRRRRRRHR